MKTELKGLEPLKNIHEVLNESAAPPRAEREDNPLIGFRVPAQTKELVERICQRHGTNPSAFLRRCCEQLISDYMP